MFLKLGTISFGGPAAHTAMMEDEVVRRRHWLSREEFLDLLGATNLIPGPNSTELAIHIGHRRAGWPGLLVAGACFILPAALIVYFFARLYVRYGSWPEVSGIVYGIKPVIIAVVLQALVSLGRTAIKSKGLAVAGSVAIALTLAGVNELVILFGTGLGMMAGRRPRPSATGRGHAAWLLSGALPLAPLATAAGAAAATPISLSTLFLFFLKVGSVLFGSGYVLLAFLRADLVERWHWITESQLLDAIAVGQFTPGPVFTTATFIGYVVHGSTGALVATLGIFLPAFFFVAISGPLIPRLRASPRAGAFLDAVNVASLALMTVVTWQLGRASVVDGFTAALAVVSAVLLFRFKLNSAWLVLGGGLLGFVAHIFGG